MTDHPVDERQTGARSRPQDRGRPAGTIAQIISLLDDRNLSRAMRLLEPNPDESDATHCVRCVTRGE
jgi:hypothetical protein